MGLVWDNWDTVGFWGVCRYAVGMATENVRFQGVDIPIRSRIDRLLRCVTGAPCVCGFSQYWLRDRGPLNRKEFIAVCDLCGREHPVASVDGSRVYFYFGGRAVRDRGWRDRVPMALGGWR